MDVRYLQNEYVEYLTSLRREGIVDDQFNQLQKLQDESSPNFVFEVVCLFFEDCQKLIAIMDRALGQSPNVDYQVVGANVHQLKGSSSSIGAARFKNLCVAFRSCADSQNFEGCKTCLQQIDHEFMTLKNKLQRLFALEQQITAAGGLVPMMDT